MARNEGSHVGAPAVMKPASGARPAQLHDGTRPSGKLRRDGYAAACPAGARYETSR